MAVPFSMEYQDSDALCGVPHHRRAFTGDKRYGSRHLSKDSYILSGTNEKWGSLLQFVGRCVSASGIDRSPIAASHYAVRKSRAVASAKAEEKAIKDAENQAIDSLLHWRDPVYKAFPEAFDKTDRPYTLCGEKASRTSISPGTAMPTCEVCLRMVLIQRAQQWQDEQAEKHKQNGIKTIAQKLAEIAARKPAPIPEPRPGIMTAPKHREHVPTFEEMLEDGTMGFDPTAFFNRRNWGERRSGGMFREPDSGTQHNHSHRGDWRHERGGVNHR